MYSKKPTMLSASSTTQTFQVLLEAATDSRRWYNVLEYLYRELHVDGIALGEYDLTTKRGKIDSYVGYNPDYIRLYEKRCCKEDPWFDSRDRCLAGDLISGDELELTEQLTTTGFYTRWLMPQGFSYRLCGIIDRHGEHIVYLEIMCGPEGKNRMHQDRMFLKSVLPYFKMALKCNGYLWQLALLRNMVDNLPVGVVAVDKGGKVLIANKIALEELDRGRGLLMRSSQLFASAPNINVKLQDTIAAAATDANLPAETLVVRRGGHLAPIWMVITPLKRMLRRVVGQETQVALVFLGPPERLNQPLAMILRTRYGLTPREEKLTLLIVEGHRLMDAAEILGISLNTARTHMKRIYTKTQTSHQSELVRVLLTGPLSLLGLQNVNAA
jgi:DNA-binding CsgD family transcriptional regulator